MSDLIKGQTMKQMLGDKQFSFALALDCLKKGEKVQRIGWNGKGMWLILIHPPEVKSEGYAYKVHAAGRTGRYITEMPDQIELLPFIGMKTADNKFVPWLASQTDILAEDWQVVE